MRSKNKRGMNLYLVLRPQCAYDEYKGLVVAAESATEALSIEPPETDDMNDLWFDVWPDDQRTIQLIGRYEGPQTEPHVVLASFRAG